MPSTYTLNNGIELIGTGEQSGTWGDTTNTNMELLDTALDGQVSIALTSAGSSGSPNSLPISDGANSNGRNRLVVFTGTPGAADATVYVQLTPNDSEKIIYVRNNLGGTRVIRLFQGTYSASNDYDVPQGTTAVVFFNGAGTGAVAANVFNNAYFDGLRLGSVSVTAILDEDDMSSDSATALATQQSIKKYVDDKAAAQDTLAEVLANGNTTGGTNVLFGDDDKAIFGAGSDLQIYSDGANSIIHETDGTGNLIVKASNINLQNSGGTATLAQFIDGGKSSLRYNNVERLVTTSTGVDVTGTAVTDGLTVAGNVSVDGGTIKLDGNYPNGTGNVALGNQAGDALASGGNYNVALGSAALSAVTTGDQNVAIGNGALQVSTASSNVAVGYLAGGSLITGSSNVALGVNALNDMVSGSNNTVVGKQAGDALGDEIVATATVSGVNYTIQTLGTTDFTLIGASSNTVGGTFTATGAGSGTGTASANANYNTFVGHQSGDVIVGGSKNSILGRFDGNQGDLDIRNSDSNIVLSDGDGNPRLAYVSANAELVINEQSANVDFRVESNNNANMLFVDAGNDKVGVGTNTLQATMHVFSGDSGASVHSNANELFVENSADAGITIGSGNTSSGSLRFADDGGTGRGIVYYDHSNDNLVLYTGGSERVRINSTETVFNEDSVDTDFRVETNNSSATLFVNGEYDGVGIHTTSPTSYANAQAVLYIEDNANPAIGISDTGQTRDWWIVGLGDGLGIRYADGSNTGSASNLTEAMFFKNTGFVGVGATSSPLAGLHLSDGTNAGSPQNATRAATLMIDAGATASADLQFMVRQGYNSHIFFGDASDPNVGMMYYDHSANHMSFVVNTATALTIDDEGDVGIGNTDPTSRLVIEKTSARTNDAENMVRIVHNTSGTSAVGFGSKILFAGERSNGTLQNMGRIGFVSDVNTSSNLSSALILEPASNGTPFEAMRIASTGETTFQENLILGASEASTGGVTILEGHYTSGNALPTLGSLRSSGNTMLGRGVEPSGTAANGFVSSAAQNLGRAAVEVGANEIRFWGAAASETPRGDAVTMTNRMTVESNGNVTIEDGNLVVASGHGIDFSATAGSGASELLDDYEEGTWTPSLTGSTSSASTSGGSFYGYYTKVGQLVTAKFEIQNTTISGGSGYIQIPLSNLPYTPNFLNGGREISGGACETYQVTWPHDGTIGTRLEPGDGIQFQVSRNAGAWSIVTTANAAGSSKYFAGFVTYRTTS